ncbi:MAG: DNA polymerase III subunit alpha [Bacteroidales bacterium]|nr:DNA polymerase III subunit alpha [Bacteroidales bacterium]
MFLIYDTETTGLPKNDQAPLTDFDNWPRLVQLAWQLHDEQGELIEVQNFIVKPDGFIIPRGAEKVHGISTERAQKEGHDLKEVLKVFSESVAKADIIIGHNIEFDNTIMQVEYLRMELACQLDQKTIIDTKEASTDYCAIPGGRGGKFKWPKLSELYLKLFGTDFDASHNASADVQATARSFFELLRLGVIDSAMLNMAPDLVKRFRETHPEVMEDIGLEVTAYHEFPEEEIEEDEPEVSPEEPVEFSGDHAFTHLHVHTQFSVLDGLSALPKLMSKAKEDGMTAVAITDHGNMFGAKAFHVEAKKNKIKPILGCEVYVARRGMDLKENKLDASGWHLVLLAKNQKGYQNLLTLVSAGWTRGYYYKPRIDKELLRQHNEGLIALTSCLSGEIPDRIMHEGIEKAEEALLEYKDIFGDDLYLELQRHKTGEPEMDRQVYEDQVYVNTELVKLSEKHQLKVVATNDVHFVDAEDAGAHDRLICIGSGKDLDDPNRKHYTQQEWFKTQQEMRELFADIPDALTNTEEIAEKIEFYELDHKPIMPEFRIPEEFKDADEYLRHITFEGAKIRYEEITDEIKERIDFELETIKNMGFPDYFLIVWDFLEAARKMGVAVGPGRGSAAGSVVAYCLKITQIDPIEYNLLFERFLNPDRISMPDIDIDFDDDGREKVLHWVSEKYGKERVAHLITFGTMAAKSAIRDVSRVQKLPLSEADRLAKMVPERPGVNLADALKEVPELKQELEKGRPEIQSVIKNALTLEGSVRNTGTHACGIIIARDNLEKYVPVSTVKESVLDYATQFDGKYIESIGLLKMDFLGLKTLSIIKDAVENIKRSKGVEVDIDNISLEDKETYELYSRGETTGLFQFESDGMKKYLRDLKPTRFEDLIAMNALYRPGPMAYIPNFINRKHGREKIEYDFPVMEEILKETYGITVYQEQVMLLSRLMAGFTRGQSDSLRKAMGKKKIEEMNKLKIEYLNGCEKNGIDKTKAEKVWKDWEEFAKYAFNKSHATCYSYVSYQTAYLKAHYPAEYMAAVLSRNLNSIEKITFFIKEANRMGIQVLGPDINESALQFTVNKQGIIRFGMAAIKGVGGSAVENIIAEREENGPFKDVYDVAMRVNLKSVNKRSFEALAQAGAFDSFEETHRAQYFYKENDNDNEFLEKILRFGNKFQENKNSTQVSLFGDVEEIEMEHPPLPECTPWPVTEQLKKEKDVLGFYISGHPLDDFASTIRIACNTDIITLRNDLTPFRDKFINFGGIVTQATQRATKSGSFFGIFTVEDFTGSIELRMFSETYLKMRHMLVEGNMLFIKAKVEASRYDESNLNINIIEISLLEEVLDKIGKNITLAINPKIVDEDFIRELKSMVQETPGETTLHFTVNEGRKKRPISMRSKSMKVNPRKFIDKLEAWGKVPYILNGKK